MLSLQLQSCTEKVYMPVFGVCGCVCVCVCVCVSQFTHPIHNEETNTIQAYIIIFDSFKTPAEKNVYILTS